MKIAGIWSGHDCSYCILEDGRPIVHDEYERFLREKEPDGDSVQFLLDNYDKAGDIKYFASCLPDKKLVSHDASLNIVGSIVNKNEGNLFFIGHHQAHAANAFFSSNLDKSLIITLDGGGIEQGGKATAATIWAGEGNKIVPIHIFDFYDFNIGGVWTRVTRYVFNMQSGHPLGHQAGTVMALAAFGNPERFHEDFFKMMTVDNQLAYHKPLGQKNGQNVGEDPEHPYLNKYRILASESEQNRFDLAAGLQSATELRFKTLLQSILIQNPSVNNLCLAGGVALNSVMTGKIMSWFPQIENIYIPPATHDGGLTIGAAQYVWHQVLDNPRITWKDNFTPYLGKTYSKEDVEKAIERRIDNLVVHTEASDDDVISYLMNQEIISVFGGGSESGKRALGNRSILADPRSPTMKDTINEKVKHRQWFRPFAPSILRDEVKNWFVDDVDSPYMSFVLMFKEDCKLKVPAVVHKDGSARLQTVSANDNEWYHGFLKKWHQASSVPILLNTSFNDREPICETPDHALDCFLRTNIDKLYFYNYGIVVSKK